VSGFSSFGLIISSGYIISKFGGQWRILSLIECRMSLSAMHSANIYKNKNKKEYKTL